MQDLISRQAAIDAIRAMQTYKLFAGDDQILVDQAGAQTELMMLPPAQPRPRGRWIERNPQNSPDCRLIECSECGNAYIVGYNIDYDDWTDGRNFCVNCGADMREEGDE